MKLATLPILVALALPIIAGPIVDSPAPRALSPERIGWIREMLANGTEDAGLTKRSTTFSTSRDGVDSAGFYYSLYNANGAEVGYTESPATGQFQLGWSTNSKEAEFLGGKGFRGGNPRSLTWNGYFTAEGDWTLAVYGWTTNPVTEWYIVESHGTGTPGNGHILGQVYSDGGVYDVYSLPYRNVPKIYGVTNFNQLWSVRRTPRTTGTVDVRAHFRRWKELGLVPGNPVFQMVTLEGFKGRGYVDFTVA
ncbi:glycoside hydrolase family 11 protein [Aspergillus saccharolyticus JOP 1030-1]|uniref:Endo-1,4-beta-xylanase n=1 Tax=Aspergillus saccharolyticus JOP 1030-1 TaxID=1450539 RepID=A0A318ZBI8_9EURO|nr:putative endo-1,4-beta-xylanase B precursor [Aspergillus saccharolyticus JOP 1030-1]PYH44746.1 putative endo-1,4-beta-xylanase B precursor [Aspergillus saccharolyticus JOP 1030-1]